MPFASPLPEITQVENPRQIVTGDNDGYDYYSIKALLYFKRSQTDFEETYLTNAEQMKVITDFVDALGNAELVSAEAVGAASPEGSLLFNTMMATLRAKRLKEFLYSRRPEVFRDSIRWKVRYEYEDWSRTIELTKQSNVQHKDEAINIMMNEPYETFDKDGRLIASRKDALKALYKGIVWKELDERIFPYCRCAYLTLVIKRLKAKMLEPIKVAAQETDIDMPSNVNTVEAPEATRKPMLAVKTNLLLYGLYMSKYGWAPVPNLAIEFLPRMGHFTAGASLDMPWYQNYSNHKFFQIRNWQLEGRRYFRNDAEFWGWYVQAYIHTAVWGVGFSKEEGWEGESFGFGIGGGYVLPLTADKHWKLEFNLQLGYIRSQYDPYVYGHPTDGAEDGLYYYDWKLDPDKFKERRYKHNWFGPTRVGVTLSYDLLYYRRRMVK